jgi:hypothetical protein
MFIRSITQRQERLAHRIAPLVVTSAVVADVARCLEDRMTLLDLTSPPEAYAFGADVRPARAD